jgi:uncharacterized phage-associated protein
MRQQQALKVAQAAGVLMRAEATTDTNYMRLIKLLYLADRENLRQSGRTMTGDRVVAMKKGPVLSGMLDLIKGQGVGSEIWQKFFRTVHYRVEMRENPGLSELSRFEVELLELVSRQHEDCDEWDLVEKPHEFEEWRKHFQEGTSVDIPLESLLMAVGRADDTDRIMKENHDREAFEQFFSRGPAV